jgi:hypothetical protein
MHHSLANAVGFSAAYNAWGVCGNPTDSLIAAIHLPQLTSVMHRSTASQLCCDCDVCVVVVNVCASLVAEPRGAASCAWQLVNMVDTIIVMTRPWMKNTDICTDANRVRERLGGFPLRAHGESVDILLLLVEGRPALTPPSFLDIFASSRTA